MSAIRLLSLILVCIGITTNLSGQQLRGFVSGHQSAKTDLWNYDITSYSYKKYRSAQTDVNGNFIMDQPQQAGLYGLSFHAEAAAPEMYVWLGEGYDIQFSASITSPEASVEWIKDVSNQATHTVDAEAGALNNRLRICRQILDIYPDTAGRFYRQVQDEFLNIQREMQRYSAKTASAYAQSVAGRLAGRYYFQYPGNKFRSDDREAHFRKHYLDSVDFTDPVLQHSHFLTEKINEYFSLYGFPEKFDNASKAAEALKPAVNALISHCLGGAFTRDDPAGQLNAIQYVSGYLFQRFNRMGMDELTDEVAGLIPDELLLQDICKDENGDTAASVARILTYKRLFPGNKAPDFIMDPPQNSVRQLGDIPAKYTLLVFWASWCTHCEQLLPLIHNLYKETERSVLEVVAVSVDTDRNAWQRAISAHQYSWINHCSGKGWDDPAALSYGITGTPTIFLLDADKKIAGKPQSKEHLLKLMGR